MSSIRESIFSHKTCTIIVWIVIMDFLFHFQQTSTFRVIELNGRKNDELLSDRMNFKFHSDYFHIQILFLFFQQSTSSSSFHSGCLFQFVILCNLHLNYRLEPFYDCDIYERLPLNTNHRCGMRLKGISQNTNLKSNETIL